LQQEAQQRGKAKAQQARADAGAPPLPSPC
jgi:hypothetical protein